MMVGLDQRRHDMIRAMQSEFEITDPAVLDAVAAVPRHCFVDKEDQQRAYDATHLWVKNGVTISHPGFVAYMVEHLRLTPASRVLDIGGGTGYHAAVMARIAGAVYSIEYIEAMVNQSRSTLADLGYNNVTMLHGDGFEGLQEEAPFDAINVVCTVNHIPIHLVNQLKVGGRMVLPVGSTEHETGRNAQKLVLVVKTQDPFEHDGVKYDSFYNSFDLRWAHVVPMVGKAQG